MMGLSELCFHLCSTCTKTLLTEKTKVKFDTKYITVSPFPSENFRSAFIGKNSENSDVL